MLVRPVEPLEEPPLLLVLRDVQEELEDHRAVADQVPLEGVDVLVAPPPELLRRASPSGSRCAAEQLGVDLHDEDVLVVRPVEDADPAPLGQAPHVPPEEVVVELLGRRLLEAEDLAALGVDPGHDVLDRAVLAGRVHRLEDDQHRVAVVGVEQVLGLGQVREVLVEDLPGPLLQGVLAEFLHLLGLRPAGVVVLEPDRLAGGHPEQVDDVLANHGRPPRMISPARGGGSPTGVGCGPTGHPGILRLNRPPPRRRRARQGWRWGCPSPTAGAAVVGRSGRVPEADQPLAEDVIDRDDEPPEDRADRDPEGELDTRRVAGEIPSITRSGRGIARRARPRPIQLIPRKIRLIPRKTPITHSADAGHSCQIITPRTRSMIPLARDQPHAPNR